MTDVVLTFMTESRLKEMRQGQQKVQLSDTNNKHLEEYFKNQLGLLTIGQNEGTLERPHPFNIKMNRDSPLCKTMCRKKEAKFQNNVAF